MAEASARDAVVITVHLAVRKSVIFCKKFTMALLIEDLNESGSALGNSLPKRIVLLRGSPA
jgi:hypothetical protein